METTLVSIKGKMDEQNVINAKKEILKLKKGSKF
jgi:hypothetical protein